jgi:histidine triad (HIT) family protein
MQEPSIFTKIIKGELSCQKVYEDDRVIAFMEMHPINEGHTLVVPKKQINHIWDMEDEDYFYLLAVAKKIGIHIREVIGSPRVGIVVEGFGVPHVHIHLIPIYHGNDLKKMQDKTQAPDIEALTRVANKIKM